MEDSVSHHRDKLVEEETDLLKSVSQLVVVYYDHTMEAEEAQKQLQPLQVGILACSCLVVEEARIRLAFLSLAEEVAALLRICLFAAAPVVQVLSLELSLYLSRMLVVEALEIHLAF